MGSCGKPKHLCKCKKKKNATIINNENNDLDNWVEKNIFTSINSAS